MIQLPLTIQQKLAQAQLALVLETIQEECLQHGYLVHVTAILGTGAFGTVFLAERAGELVAIKVSVPQPGLEGSFAAICEEEGHKACALAALPHVAGGREYWFARSVPLFFLATRYVHGMSLSTYLERTPGRLSEERLRAWALQLTGGLAAMHRAGVVHRDVKPENILLEVASDQVYLADLGIAKYARSGTLLDLRSTGTHPYAPPEQIRGRTSPKSDQYALGIVLFELATREAASPPVPAPRFGYPWARPRLLAPQQYTPALSSGFATVIERLAALNPSDRFPTMQHAREALLALHHPGEVPEAQRSLTTGRGTAVSPPRHPPADVPSPARRARRSSPAFAWRPLFHLRQVVLGGPISLGGPPLSRAGMLSLMALYYSWIVAGGLCAGFVAGAESHDERWIVWALVGTACVAMWFILRHWTIPFVQRRGSLGARSRGALVLMALSLALFAAGFLVRTVLGQRVGVVSPVWLGAICSFFVWWFLYVGIEIWVN